MASVGCSVLSGKDLVLFPKAFEFDHIAIRILHEKGIVLTRFVSEEAGLFESCREFRAESLVEAVPKLWFRDYAKVKGWKHLAFKAVLGVIKIEFLALRESDLVLEKVNVDPVVGKATELSTEFVYIE